MRNPQKALQKQQQLHKFLLLLKLIMNAGTIHKSTYLKKIETALDTIRPFLLKDGGNIEVVELTKDMVVKVRLLGSCETCPMSASTMKAGVEESIKKAIPEIKSVIAVA
jgi:Fe-S cluster biogenesis protein NfuA